MWWMNSPIILYKNLGETPLACMERYRSLHTELVGVPMTYAGRLDPLAEGVLIVLAGDAVHEKEKYLNLDKEYLVDVLFGFDTDTHDVLGMVDWTRTNVEQTQKESGVPLCGTFDLTTQDQIKSVLQTFLGSRTQKYPRFSSRTIFGKPLFAWAKKGELNEEDIPSREITIHSILLVGMKTITCDELDKIIEDKINTVVGDFRQESILKQWKEIFAIQKAENELLNYTVATIRVSCSSGTYMRTLASEIGKKLGISSLALHICRTKVGLFRAINEV